ncbi:MAG: ribonuclease D [Pelagibacteraceae bacterium]|nr:ribonuclease D [Pelagibacteraceae bacterium]|tara:strand:+ start:1061 stop:1696 length:636 start_codon:yes stop_codon:yes gene_type:complete
MDSNYQLFKNDLPKEILDTFKTSLSVDTETLGLNINRDRLCLVQIMNNDNGKFYIIQFPKNFKLSDSKNLKILMQDKNIMKIFHYARFDIAMLKKNLNINVKNIFCTKIASKLTRTYTSNHGLKDLVQEILKIEISKKEQSSDWGQEKLTSDQIEYALNDVRYLHEIKENLQKKLDSTSRQKLFDNVVKFLETRVKLDMAGWEDVDIFAHH